MTTVSIRLNRGLDSTIDAEDASALSGLRWSAHTRMGRTYASGSYSRQMHRMVLERMLGRKLQRHEDVDHINGDSLDNRRCNLRLCSKTENARNHKLYRTNTSGRSGVAWRKDVGKWQVKIADGRGNHIHLGYFASFDEACEVRDRAESRQYGVFAPEA